MFVCDNASSEEPLTENFNNVGFLLGVGVEGVLNAVTVRSGCDSSVAEVAEDCVNGTGSSRGVCRECIGGDYVISLKRVCVELTAINGSLESGLSLRVHDENLAAGLACDKSFKLSNYTKRGSSGDSASVPKDTQAQT